MQDIHFSILMLGYFGTSALVFVAAWQYLKDARLFSILGLAISLLGLSIAAVAGGNTLAGENFLVFIFNSVLSFSRLPVAALGIGICAALPTILLLRQVQVRWLATMQPLVVLGAMLGTLALLALLSARELITQYLPHPGTGGGVAMTRLVEEGFVIEDLAETEAMPIRIALSDTGKVYFTGQIGIAAQSGGVFELLQDDDGSYTSRQVASMLNRPYGLIAHGDDLYVSRSGQHAKWNKGKAENLSTGAVTLLRDLNGDGYMDYYHDVVPDLPGARAPDYLHQNNDLAIGPDGAMYITNAFNSDALPARHPYEGVILRASGEDFSELEVWAKGLRNPFGLKFGPQGKLFATDNDAQSGVLGNLGDKLVEVVKDGDYGHPYAHEGNPDVADHLLRSKFALAGLTYATSPALPDHLRDALFVVSYGEGRIMRVVFHGNEASLVPFATIPGAVDISAAPNGDFYVAVYPTKIVRIRLSSQHSTGSGEAP